MAQPHTAPSTTREVEVDAARVDHGADRPAIPEEERLADSNRLDPEVAKSVEEANERGAAQKGEGRVS
ncbi:MAG TPA: hypothetical protein VNF50_01945 [Acidimicrobiales bacterium]|nr:hypothetical protein [Acidimicrobiales bacterium]